MEQAVLPVAAVEAEVDTAVEVPETGRAPAAGARMRVEAAVAEAT